MRFPSTFFFSICFPIVFKSKIKKKTFLIESKCSFSKPEIDFAIESKKNNEEKILKFDQNSLAIATKSCWSQKKRFHTFSTHSHTHTHTYTYTDFDYIFFFIGNLLSKIAYKSFLILGYSKCAEEYYKKKLEVLMFVQ